MEGAWPPKCWFPTLKLHGTTTQKTMTSISLLWKPWVMHQEPLARQQCSGYISLITNFSPEVGGSTASEMLVSNHQTTQCNNLENYFYFSAMKTWITQQEPLWVGNNPLYTSWVQTSTLKMEGAQPPKCIFPLTKLCGARMQKIAFITCLFHTLVLKHENYILYWNVFMHLLYQILHT
jgi:hypothetical protein